MGYAAKRTGRTNVGNIDNKALTYSSDMVTTIIIQNVHTVAFYQHNHGSTMMASP